ncbi:hypothetical protein T458_06155 [Brevibacillus panacihumi W25]|uniref:Uncharacterized protein n=2 Tax=Brevibacillus TaxID=55080 RepID=V6MCN4_9BACL|nr:MULTISPECIES: hypothetical protein [Brevibacillus]EST55655.1 hypothetical protein T458_06155 [Brevibacillus panacihumi W25]RNB75721.1 hypothetical protein EDM52_04680 [Brevibacillus invocatus]
MVHNKVILTVSDIELIHEMCNGKIPLYQIAANFQTYNGTLLTDFAKEEIKEVYQAFINRLSALELPPNEAFISDDGITAHWYPPFPFFFENPIDFYNLLENFQSYLNTFGFTKGTIMDLTWDDQANKLTNEEALYQRLFGVSIQAEKLEYSHITDQLSNHRSKLWRSILVYDFRSDKGITGDPFPKGFY